MKSEKINNYQKPEGLLMGEHLLHFLQGQRA
jgi:hypothetical protein